MSNTTYRCTTADAVSASATCRERGATDGAAAPLKGAVASCAGVAGADARTTTVFDDDDDEGADVDAGEARRRADMRPARTEAIGRVSVEVEESGKSAGKSSVRGEKLLLAARK